MGNQSISRSPVDSLPELESIVSAPFAPRARFGEGILLATTSRGEIRAFDPFSDTEPHIFQMPKSAGGSLDPLPRANCFGICYVPILDNMVLLAAENDFVLVQLEPGELLVKPIQVLRHHSKTATNSAFIPTSDLLVTASYDKTFAVCSVADPSSARFSASPIKVERTVDAHRDLVYAVRWSPLWPNRLLTGSCDNTGKIWDLSSLEMIGELEGHGGSVYGIELNESGDIIATGSFDRTVRLWDARTFEAIATCQNDAQIWSSFWARERNLYVGGTYEGFVTVWDVRNTKTHYARWDGHTRNSYTQGCTEIDRTCFATASGDCHVKVWSYEGKMLKDYTVESSSKGVCYVRTHEGGVVPVEAAERVSTLLECEEEFITEMCLFEIVPEIGKMRLWAFLFFLVEDLMAKDYHLLFDIDSQDEEAFLRMLLGDMKLISSPVELARHVRILLLLGLKDVAFVLCTSGFETLEKSVRMKHCEDSGLIASSVEASMKWLEELTQVLLDEEEASTYPACVLFVVRDRISVLRETEFREAVDDYLKVRQLFEAVSAKDEDEPQSLLRHRDFIDRGEFVPKYQTLHEASRGLRASAHPFIREGSRGVVKLCVGSSSLLCHLDLMALRSQFFSRMLHFGGVEVDELNQRRAITLSTFDMRSLKILVFWMYTGRIEIKVAEIRETLPSLFKLVQHCLAFGESQLRWSLVRVLVAVSKSFPAEDLRAVLQDYGELDDDSGAIICRALRIELRS